MKWTEEDSAIARTQGWDLIECWEDGKFVWVIFKHDKSSTFATDEAARLFVAHRAKTSKEAICHKAVAVAFRSQMPDFEEVAKRAKPKTKRSK